MRLHLSCCLVAATPLPLDVGYPFLVGSNILPLRAVQQRVAILMFSQEKMSTRPSTLSSGSLQLQAFSFLSEPPGTHGLYVESQCRQVGMLMPCPGDVH